MSSKVTTLLVGLLAFAEGRTNDTEMLREANADDVLEMISPQMLDRIAQRLYAEDEAHLSAYERLLESDKREKMNYLSSFPPSEKAHHSPVADNSPSHLHHQDFVQDAAAADIRGHNEIPAERLEDILHRTEQTHSMLAKKRDQDLQTRTLSQHELEMQEERRRTRLGQHLEYSRHARDLNVVPETKVPKTSLTPPGKKQKKKAKEDPLQKTKDELLHAAQDREHEQQEQERRAQEDREKAIQEQLDEERKAREDQAKQEEERRTRRRDARKRKQEEAAKRQEEVERAQADAERQHKKEDVEAQKREYANSILDKYPSLGVARLLQTASAEGLTLSQLAQGSQDPSFKVEPRFRKEDQRKPSDEKGTELGESLLADHHDSDEEVPIIDKRIHEVPQFKSDVEGSVQKSAYSQSSSSSSAVSSSSSSSSMSSQDWTSEGEGYRSQDEEGLELLKLEKRRRATLMEEDAIMRHEAAKRHRESATSSSLGQHESSSEQASWEEQPLESEGLRRLHEHYEAQIAEVRSDNEQYNKHYSQLEGDIKRFSQEAERLKSEAVREADEAHARAVSAERKAKEAEYRAVELEMQAKEAEQRVAKFEKMAKEAEDRYRLVEEEWALVHAEGESRERGFRMAEEFAEEHYLQREARPLRRPRQRHHHHPHKQHRSLSRGQRVRGPFQDLDIGEGTPFEEPSVLSGTPQPLEVSLAGRTEQELVAQTAIGLPSTVFPADYTPPHIDADPFEISGALYMPTYQHHHRGRSHLYRNQEEQPADQLHQRTPTERDFRKLLPAKHLEIFSGNEVLDSVLMEEKEKELELEAFRQQREREIKQEYQDRVLETTQDYKAKLRDLDSAYSERKSELEHERQLIEQGTDPTTVSVVPLDIGVIQPVGWKLAAKKPKAPPAAPSGDDSSVDPLSDIKRRERDLLSEKNAREAELQQDYQTRLAEFEADYQQKERELEKEKLDLERRLIAERQQEIDIEQQEALRQRREAAAQAQPATGPTRAIDEDEEDDLEDEEDDDDEDFENSSENEVTPQELEPVIDAQGRYQIDWEPELVPIRADPKPTLVETPAEPSPVEPKGKKGRKDKKSRPLPEPKKTVEPEPAAPTPQRHRHAVERNPRDTKKQRNKRNKRNQEDQQPLRHRHRHGAQNSANATNEVSFGLEYRRGVQESHGPVVTQAYSDDQGVYGVDAFGQKYLYEPFDLPQPAMPRLPVARVPSRPPHPLGRAYSHEKAPAAQARPKLQTFGPIDTEIVKQALKKSAPKAAQKEAEVPKMTSKKAPSPLTTPQATAQPKLIDQSEKFSSSSASYAHGPNYHFLPPESPLQRDLQKEGYLPYYQDITPGLVRQPTFIDSEASEFNSQVHALKKEIESQVFAQMAESHDLHDLGHDSDHDHELAVHHDDYDQGDEYAYFELPLSTHANEMALKDFPTIKPMKYDPAALAKKLEKARDLGNLPPEEDEIPLHRSGHRYQQKSFDEVGDARPITVDMMLGDKEDRPKTASDKALKTSERPKIEDVAAKELKREERDAEKKTIRPESAFQTAKRKGSDKPVKKEAKPERIMQKRQDQKDRFDAREDPYGIDFEKIAQRRAAKQAAFREKEIQEEELEEAKREGRPVEPEKMAIPKLAVEQVSRASMEEAFEKDEERYHAEVLKKPSIQDFRLQFEGPAVIHPQSKEKSIEAPKKSAPALAPEAKPVATATKPVATATKPVATATKPVATATKPVATATKPVAKVTPPKKAEEKPAKLQMSRDIEKLIKEREASHESFHLRYMDEEHPKDMHGGRFTYGGPHIEEDEEPAHTEFHRRLHQEQRRVEELGEDDFDSHFDLSGGLKSRQPEPLKDQKAAESKSALRSVLEQPARRPVQRPLSKSYLPTQPPAIQMTPQTSTTATKTKKEDPLALDIEHALHHSDDDHGDLPKFDPAMLAKVKQQSQPQQPLSPQTTAVQPKPQEAAPSSVSQMVYPTFAVDHEAVEMPRFAYAQPVYAPQVLPQPMYSYFPAQQPQFSMYTPVSPWYEHYQQPMQQVLPQWGQPSQMPLYPSVPFMPVEIDQTPQIYKPAPVTQTKSLLPKPRPSQDVKAADPVSPVVETPRAQPSFAASPDVMVTKTLQPSVRKNQMFQSRDEHQHRPHDDILHTYSGSEHPVILTDSGDHGVISHHGDEYVVSSDGGSDEDIVSEFESWFGGSHTFFLDSKHDLEAAWQSNNFLQ